MSLVRERGVSTCANRANPRWQRVRLVRVFGMSVSGKFLMNDYWQQIEDPEWHCQNSKEQRQHQEELARDWDAETEKQPPWWHHIEEWLKEKASGHD